MRDLKVNELSLVSGGCPEDGQEYCWEDISTNGANMGQLMDALEDYWAWAGRQAAKFEACWDDCWG